MSRYLVGHWAESRGDEFDSWGTSTWYFEIDDSQRVSRQVEIYTEGPVLRYGPTNPEDAYGLLSELDNTTADLTEVTHDEFESAWVRGSDQNPTPRTAV